MKNINKTKYEYLLDCNSKYMNMVALSFDNKKITYEEMHEQIEKFVRLLYAKGIRSGDIIGVITLNTPESVYLLYALDIIGAVVVGYSPLDNAEKIKKDFEIVRPKMIIYVDMCYSNFKDSEKSLNFSSILYSPFEPLNNLNIKCINNIKKNISNIIIVCEDTGKGIKKEYINRLFNKFDRLDVERNTTTEGTGLGLAISKPFTKEQIKDKINNILSD